MSKNTKSIPILSIPNWWKIDSLRFEVPLDHININPLLMDDYKLLNESTGEVSDLKSYQKKKALEHTTNGVTYYTWIGSRYNPNAKKVEEFLVFLVNAKMLFKDYFKGITDETVYQLYNNILNTKHFKMSFDQFLSCYVYDIDICRDFYTDYDTFRWWTEKYKYIDVVNVKKYVRNGVTETLQFNHREKAKLKYPYAKFYSKKHEALKPNTREFYRLNNIDTNSLNELYRFEFTIKSSKMLNHFFEEKENTLSNLLNILKCQKKISEVAQRIHDIYTGELKIAVKANDYKSIPMLLRFIIIQGYHLGKKFSTIEAELNEYLQPMDKSGKSRIMKQIKMCYLEQKDIVRYHPYQEKQIEVMLVKIFG